LSSNIGITEINFEAPEQIAVAAHLSGAVSGACQGNFSNLANLGFLVAVLITQALREQGGEQEGLILRAELSQGVQHQILEVFLFAKLLNRIK
jgi:hypothetical protein